MDRTSLLRPTAPSFHPSPAPLTCKFFARGRCRNGQACGYLHATPAPPLPPATNALGTIHANELPLEGNDTSEREMKGADVRFGDGARVLKVQLRSTAGKGETPATRTQVCTVSCAWYNASKVVWLHYRTKAWATNAMKRFEEKFQGRRLQAYLQPPPRYHSRPKAIWSIRLGNVPANATKEELGAALTGIQPNDIILGKPTTELEEDDAAAFIKDLLSQSGRKLRSFEAGKNTTGSRAKAFARFERSSDVRTALELNGVFFPELGSKLFVEHVAAVYIPILRPLYSVLTHQIQELQINNTDGVRIAVQVQGKSKALFVRIYGADTRAVSTAKARLGNLLAGKVVLDDMGLTLWHKFFTTSLGLSILESDYRDGEHLIHSDMRKQQLLFYGPEALYGKTQRRLIDLLASHNASYLIPLHGDAFNKALSGGFRKVVRKFGANSATLDIISKPPTVTFTGSAPNFEVVRALLSEETNLKATERKAEGDRECPLCFSEVVDQVKLPCNHVYCRGCFDALCEEANGTGEPVACMAGLDCTQPVPLEKLHSVLGHVDFEKLLEMAFAHYVRANPLRFQFCPTVDCPTIYESTDAPSELTCTNCLVSICAKCRALSHEDLTCEEAKEQIDRERISDEDRRTMGIQDCPQCHSPIQKADGCNHVECRSCRTHICWACLAHFEGSRDCYDHMTDVHRGIGIEIMDPEVEQMQEFQAAGIDPGLWVPGQLAWQP